jgi:hypothetical protein
MNNGMAKGEGEEPEFIMGHPQKNSAVAVLL